MSEQPDFRKPLYEQYVSSFKEHTTRNDFEAESRWYEWADRKIGPLLASVPRSGSVLELGCGPGWMLAYLLRLGFQDVEGIDVSPEQVEVARERGLGARVSDVFEALAGDSRRHDAVLAIDFIEHFSRTEIARLLPLVRRVLKPGGCFIVQTPNGEGLFSRQVMYSDLTHLTIVTPASLEQLLRTYGFHQCEFRETGPVARNLRGALRVAAWAAIKVAANLVRAIETGKRQRIWTENMICLSRPMPAAPPTTAGQVDQHRGSV